MLRDMLNKLKYYVNYPGRVSHCEIESMLLSEYKEYLNRKDDVRYYQRVINEEELLESEVLYEQCIMSDVKIPLMFKYEEDEINVLYSLYNKMNYLGREIDERVLNMLAGRHFTSMLSMKPTDLIDRNNYKSENLVNDIVELGKEERKTRILVCKSGWYNILKQELEKFGLSNILHSIVIVKDYDLCYKGLMCERGAVIVEKVTNNSTIECEWDENTLTVKYIQGLKFKFDTEKINRSLVIY